MILIIKHVISEGPGLLADFFKEKKFQLKIVEFEKGRKLPESTNGFSAVISMGGPMNVYEEDKYPFLKDEDRFLKEVVKKEIPFLGICLGAQLLAKAIGAKVKKSPCKELGWFKVGLTGEGLRDLLFAGAGKELNVFQWHEDEFEIPKSGELIAIGGICKNQAFRLGKCAWGLQFHIEARPSMVEAWLEKDLRSDDEVKVSQTEKIISETYKIYEQFKKQATKIFSNFHQIILEKT